MELGIEKYTMLILKNKKTKTTKETELTNQESCRTLEQNENTKYLGISKADAIKQEEMKEN